MAGPNPIAIRPPAFAGQFYPAHPDRCAAETDALLRQNPSAVATDRWIGGLVPHAGWICSGAIAATTLLALDASTPAAGAPDCVVIFGAVHSPLPARRAALDTHRLWALPTGPIQQADDLTPRLAAATDLIDFDDRLHRHEHAIEVELPLIQRLWPNAKIIPIEVPAIADAAEIGRRVAELVLAEHGRAIFLASSDLTHYGPNYGFTPAGIGQEALDWAMRNDRRMLEAIARLDPQPIVPLAKEHHNACGAGAIAAMLAACRVAGAGRSALLDHANSCQTLAAVAPQPPTNAVGYGSMVIG